MALKHLLTLGLVALPPAFAAPAFLRRQESVDDQLEHLRPGCTIYQPEDYTMCTNTKTASMWKNLSMGEWIEGVTFSRNFYNMGIYETVRNRSAELHDIKCGDSISLDGLSPFGDCDDLVDEDKCLCQPRAYFALAAMGNFVNYMDKLREAISNAGDAVQAQVLSFPAMYNPSSGDDNDDLAIAAGVMGILGTIAGLVPELAPLGAGLGVISGIMGLVDGAQEEDDPLAPVAEISSYLGHQKENMMKAVARYTNHVMNDAIPAATEDEDGFWDNGYTDNPSELPKVLGTEGAWVDEPAAIDGVKLKMALASPAINALWNKEQIVVAKVSNKDNVLGTDPCESDDVFPDNMKHCIEGTMYVLQKWNNWEGESGRPLDGVYFDIPGWDNAIAEYGLDVQTIALSSEANQIGAGTYQPTPPDAQTLTKHFLGNDWTNFKDSQLVYYNFPVCDMNAAPFEYRGDFDNCESLDCKFNYMFLCGCAGNFDNSLNGNAFPYEVSTALCY